MRTRRAVMAGGLGLALAALGYRAWDRGVLTGAAGPAYTPWDEWGGSETEGSQRPLRAGILAASPHNTQPWLFSVADRTIEILADRARHLGTFDPFRREMHLGLGCAIENLVCAARVFGIATEVQPAPGRLELSPAPQPVMAASIALGTSQGTPDVLFETIPRRHTNRGPYREEPPVPERLRKLVDLVSGPDARVVFVSDAGARRELGAVIVKATEWIIADLDMSMDSFRWLRTGRREVLASRDGVTIDAAGIGRLMTIAAKLAPDAGPATTDRIWLDTTRDVHVATSPVFGMILVRDRLDMGQAIAAGRAWQRLHLALTAQGLAAQPLNQPVEMIDRHQMLGRPDEFSPTLRALAATTGWQPTFVFRLGYASREASRSPRRPLSEVLRAHPPVAG